MDDDSTWIKRFQALEIAGVTQETLKGAQNTEGSVVLADGRFLTAVWSDCNWIYKISGPKRWECLVEA